MVAAIYDDTFDKKLRFYAADDKFRIRPAFEKEIHQAEFEPASSDSTYAGILKGKLIQHEFLREKEKFFERYEDAIAEWSPADLVEVTKKVRRIYWDRWMEPTIRTCYERRGWRTRAGWCARSERIDVAIRVPLNISIYSFTDEIELTKTDAGTNLLEE